jgi:dTDP-4-amino-4,6-dideoxygalactose transaminase
VRIPFLDLACQTEAVSAGVLREVQSLIRQNRFIGGACVEDFESEFAAFCGTEYCIALNSGTDALRLGLIAAGVGQRDEVITSPFTFIATAEAITQTGKLVLADIDTETFTLATSEVRRKLSDRTRGIVPVHIFGLPSFMGEINALAEARGLFVIEDACQAHGAAIDKRRVGSFGDAAAFSFYPSKNLGAFGDAGALTTNRSDIADHVRLLRNHGQTELYTHGVEGYNSRMDTFQAAVVLAKLAHLDAWNRDRIRIAKIYRQELNNINSLRFQEVPGGAQHVYHVLAVLAERRDELKQFLKDRGVDTRVIYPMPLHLMPAYGYLGHKKGDFPNAEKVCDQVLCLPMYPGLGTEQAQEVASFVREFFQG